MVVSYNLLAPGYIRGGESRESWEARTAGQQKLLAAEAPGARVILLQEFEHANPGLAGLWAAWAETRGYWMAVVPRPGKADGCATLVKAELLAGGGPPSRDFTARTGGIGWRWSRSSASAPAAAAAARG